MPPCPFLHVLPLVSSNTLPLKGDSFSLVLRRNTSSFMFSVALCLSKLFSSGFLHFCHGCLFFIENESKMFTNFIYSSIIYSFLLSHSIFLVFITNECQPPSCHWWSLVVSVQMDTENSFHPYRKDEGSFPNLETGKGNFPFHIFITGDSQNLKP